MSGDAVFCEHANEVPSSPWCVCPEDCYCWKNTCKQKTHRSRTEVVRAWQEAAGLVDRESVAVGAKTEKAISDMAERFEILRWAGGRPDVLSLLGKLRALGYDERAVGYLQSIASGREKSWAESAKEVFGPTEISVTLTNVDSESKVMRATWQGMSSDMVPAPTLPPGAKVVVVDKHPPSKWHHVCLVCAEGREQKLIGAPRPMHCCECARWLAYRDGVLVNSICESCGLVRKRRVGEKHVRKGQGMCEIPV